MKYDYRISQSIPTGNCRPHGSPLTKWETREPDIHLKKTEKLLSINLVKKNASFKMRGKNFNQKEWSTLQPLFDHCYLSHVGFCIVTTLSLSKPKWKNKIESLGESYYADWIWIHRKSGTLWKKILIWQFLERASLSVIESKGASTIWFDKWTEIQSPS